MQSSSGMAVYCKLVHEAKFSCFHYTVGSYPPPTYVFIFLFRTYRDLGRSPSFHGHGHHAACAFKANADITYKLVKVLKYSDLPYDRLHRPE